MTLPRLTGCPHCHRSIRLDEGEHFCPECGKLVDVPEFNVFAEPGRFGVELFWPGAKNDKEKE